MKDQYEVKGSTKREYEVKGSNKRECQPEHAGPDWVHWPAAAGGEICMLQRLTSICNTHCVDTQLHFHLQYTLCTHPIAFSIHNTHPIAFAIDNYTPNCNCNTQYTPNCICNTQYTPNCSKGACQKKNTGFFGSFSHTRGEDLTKSQNFCDLTK